MFVVFNSNKHETHILKFVPFGIDRRQLEIGGSPHVKRGRFGSHSRGGGPQSRGGGPQSRGGGPQSRGGAHNQHNFRDEWQYPNMSSPPTPMHSDPYAKVKLCLILIVFSIG